MNRALALIFLFLSAYCILAQNCKSKVQIIVDSEKAIIYADNEFVGNGSATAELVKGKHIIRIKKSLTQWNQNEIIDTVNISECNQSYLFNYKFAGILQNKNIPVDYDLSNVKREESFFNTTVFKVLLGSAVVLGSVAAYFKIQANKKYDEYLSTKNQSTLDEVNRLDIYSGISFGLLQINFGYLIYKFLTN